METLKVLPVEIQNKWMAELIKAGDHPVGVFRLVTIRPTQPNSFEGQRVIVRVIDEDGQAMPDVKVAFSYSTADQYILTPDFTWSPPSPRRAFLVSTGANGEIDQVQGSKVKEGEPGGITVYLLTPEYASDVVAGAGMLANHTGLHLTFQLKRVGVKTLAERLTSLEDRLTRLEAKHS